MSLFNKIYANGCSFIWGHNHNNPWYFKYFDETKDIDITEFLEECKNHNQGQENTQYTNPNVFKPFNEFDWVRQKYNYANRVAEEFDVELINESVFGGSLHRLIRKTVSYIMNTEDEDLKSKLNELFKEDYRVLGNTSYIVAFEKSDKMIKLNIYNYNKERYESVILSKLFRNIVFDEILPVFYLEN
jgi:hypothetical protein